MFHIDEIKELVSMLEDSSLAVLEVQEGDSRVLLKKSAANASSIAVPAAPVQTISVQTAPATAAKQETGKTINAPIVGVFYSAPSPTADPYVSVGKRVKKGRRRMHY